MLSFEGLYNINDIFRLSCHSKVSQKFNNKNLTKFDFTIFGYLHKIIYFACQF